LTDDFDDFDLLSSQINQNHVYCFNHLNPGCHLILDHLEIVPSIHMTLIFWIIVLLLYLYA
jgi:hypothetical protein